MAAGPQAPAAQRGASTAVHPPVRADYSSSYNTQTNVMSKSVFLVLVQLFRPRSLMTWHGHPTICLRHKNNRLTLKRLTLGFPSGAGRHDQGAGGTVQAAERGAVGAALRQAHQVQRGEVVGRHGVLKYVCRRM
eukprot:6021756-Pyramimonas_sp.AAC.1